MSYTSERRPRRPRLPLLRASAVVLAAAGTVAAVAPAANADDDPRAGEMPIVRVYASDATNAGPGTPVTFYLNRSGDVSAPTTLHYSATTAVEGDDAFVAPNVSNVTFAVGEREKTIEVPVSDTGANDHAVRLTLAAPEHDAVVEDRLTTAVVESHQEGEAILDVEDACLSADGAVRSQAFASAVSGLEVDAVACAAPVAGNAHDVSFDVVSRDVDSQGVNVRFTRPAGPAAATPTSVRVRYSPQANPLADANAPSTVVTFAAGQTQKIRSLDLADSAVFSDLYADSQDTIAFATEDVYDLGAPVHTGTVFVKYPPQPRIYGNLAQGSRSRVGGGVTVEPVEGAPTAQLRVVWQRCSVVADDEGNGSRCTSIYRGSKPFADAATYVPTAADIGFRLRAFVVDTSDEHGDRSTPTTLLGAPAVRDVLQAPTLSTPQVTADGTATFTASGEDGASVRSREQGSSTWNWSEANEVTVQGLEPGSHVIEVQLVADDGTESPISTTSVVVPRGDTGGSGDTGGGSGDTGGGSGDGVPAPPATVPAAPTPAPVVPVAPVAPAPGGTAKPAPTAPAATVKKQPAASAKSALKNRTRVTVTLAGRHAFTGKAIVSKAVAKKLGLKSRVVATLKGSGSGRVTPRLVFTKAAAKALGTSRSAITLTLEIKTDDGTTSTGTLVLKRG